LEGFIRSFPHVVLFISHDETLIEGTANIIIHLELLRRKTLPRFTVYKGSYAAYRESRTEAFRKQAQQAVSDRREQKLRDKKYRRIQQSVERAQNAVSRQDPHGGRLLKKKMHAVKSLERRFEREDRELTEFPDEEEAISLLFADCPGLPAGKTVLDFSLPELRTAGEEGRLLARDLRLLVRGPDKVGIVGRNGAGKTTLLRLLAEELLPRTDLRAAYMPQNYEELLDPGKTPVEFLMTGGSREEETRIRTCLGSLKYTAAEMDHPLSELSGGQKAKVFLLGMSLSGANVLLLDEPTRNFSPLSGPVIRALLRDYPGAILSVSHDRKFLGEVCTRVLRLTEGGLGET
jgi:ATPase subunit of ABC transporter with duplicated ATPase domains